MSIYPSIRYQGHQGSAAQSGAFSHPAVDLYAGRVRQSAWRGTASVIVSLPESALETRSQNLRKYQEHQHLDL